MQHLYGPWTVWCATLLSHIHINTHGDLLSSFDETFFFISAIFIRIVLDDCDNKQALLIVSSHSLLANWQIDVELCQKTKKRQSVIFAFDYMSRHMGKSTICICENKDADQLRGNREADQRLCFRYFSST